MSTQLTIQIVGWNSASVLEPGLKALQTIPTDKVITRYIDNASRDNSVALVRTLLPQAHVVELPSNQGFAGAHNEGFKMCTTPYVLTHDPDVVLNWPGIEQLLLAFSDPKVVAVQGKLLRSKSSGSSTVSQLGTIDSAGITLTLALNGRERGANETDRGQYDAPADLIAVTGACGLYRMEALQSVAHSHDKGRQGGVSQENLEIFDNDFFAYKEDVDLGWRLKRAGYKSLYLPIDMGTHVRTLGKRGAANWGLNPVTIYQRLKSPRTRYSLRNWLWMIMKNASLSQLILHAPFIGIRKITFLLLSIFYPPLLTVWPETIRGISKMLHKRLDETGHASP